MIGAAAIAAAALVLAAPARPPPPLECPKGLEKQGAEPFEGYEVWCEVRDAAGRGRREGPSRTYYDDGAIWIEATWKGGKRDGPFVEYHRNGVKAREGRYDADRQTGLWTLRWESGAIEEEAEFEDGVAHGRFAAFRSDGTRRAEGQRCGGAPCGLWRTFGADGKKVEGEVRYETPMLAP